MKTLFLSLTLFAIGCYAQQPVQYVPVQQPQPAAAPTIIEVPKDAPQPVRPLIVVPFGERHRYDRHGTNDATPPTKPATDNSPRPLLHFASFATLATRPAEHAAPAPAASDSTAPRSTEVQAEANVSRNSSPRHERHHPHAFRQRLKERIAARRHHAPR